MRCALTPTAYATFPSCRAAPFPSPRGRGERDRFAQRTRVRGV
jgi:hypothetical protein